MLNLLQKTLQKNQALFIADPLQIQNLTGFQASFCVLLITKSEYLLFTDPRYAHLKKEFPLIIVKKLSTKLLHILKNKQISKLFLDYQQVKIPFFLKIQKKINCKNFKQLQKNILLSKNQKDIANMQTAIQITEQTLAWCLPKLSPAMKEVEFQRVLKIKALELGASDFAFQPIVAFGKNSANIHHLSGKTVLGNKPLMLIDLGFKYANMCSDMTRTYILNKSASQIIDTYRIVKKAKIASEKLYQAGESIAKTSEIANQVFKKANLSELPHSLGHGIGTQVHEAPGINHKNQDQFQANTCITCEPGVYIENQFGIRLEDIVWIKEKGNQNLNQLEIEYHTPLLKHLQRTE